MIIFCRKHDSEIDSAACTVNSKYPEIQQFLGMPFCERCVVAGTGEEVLTYDKDHNGFLVPRMTAGQANKPSVR